MLQHQTPSVLASLAKVFRIPSSSSSAINTITRFGGAGQKSTTGSISQQTAGFSSTAKMLKGKKKGGPVKTDSRITLIRYFLHHPKTPRPLRFSRNRYLRHWTIHRAWQLFRANQRRAQELELQRMQASMSEACEELRTGAGDGGKLFRRSMNKVGVFRRGVPIEYARLQTEYPATEGWNHGWTR